jgi:hypothetical protein
MRVTIIKEDNIVTVDGESFTVDCSGLPVNFHALQWYGNHGEVEYAPFQVERQWHKDPNITVADLALYQPYLDAWAAAKLAAEKVKADATQPKD